MFNDNPDLLAKLSKLANIPEELKLLNQWLCWKYEDIGSAKPTKVPYNPITGGMASTTNPVTWVSFDVACRAYSTGNYSGIGFVFTANDPYYFLDLDDTNGDTKALERQQKIYKEFDSYSELSPSGKGLHIIGIGKIPSGRRRSFVEVYSSGRYATFTGEVFNQKEITENQDKLTQLWEQMGEGGPQTFAYDGNLPQKEDDKVIIDKATNAVNGDKFDKLLKGYWQDLYPSQSEADLAMIDMLAFYTQNREQIERIFHYSALGKRLKAQRKDYLSYMINKSFDRMLPQIDFDGFKNVVENFKAEKIAGSTNSKSTAFDAVNASASLAPVANTIKLPPGLIGEIAQYIYHSSPRPVPEIALAAAIGLVSGIAGRAYNVSGTGLNQYVLLLAATGCHAKGTKILMYDGTLRAVESIWPGELIMGPDSKPRKVLGLAYGQDTMVKIRPTKGEDFIVNLDHVLSLSHTVTKDITNLTVREYITKNKTFKHTHKLYKTPVEFINSNKLPLDPWFLGAMLGDGSFGPSIRLTSADACIRAKAAKVIDALDGRLTTSQIKGNKASQDAYVKLVKSNDKSKLQIILTELGLWLSKSHNKFIPEIYKTASRENRLAILAGLIDTDGHLNGPNGYDYISKSERLSDDVIFIARSLGFAAYKTICEKYSQNGSGGIYYRVSISGDLEELPVTLAYKKAQSRLQKKNHLVTGFTYEILFNGDYYGFQLDQDHLYLTGDFTVHHNSGKEGMQAGISKLINIIKQQVPGAGDFIGPSEIASGQALFRYISNKSQCFVSVLGEFGLRLMQMANTNANGAEVSLRRMLLDFYNKSGHKDVAQPSIYADKDKNSAAIQSPAFTILGESTPERFYGCLNEDMISEGLLPRFLLIEYHGERVAFNENHGDVLPNAMLIERLTTLAANSLTIQNANNPRRVVNVIFTPEAKKFASQYDKYCDKQINNSSKDIAKQLWNRAHIKTLKLAACIAVGCNMYDPCIEVAHLEWAISMINNDINMLSTKFDKGEIGYNTQESRQVDEVTRMIKDYVLEDWDKIKKYCADAKIERMHTDKVISYAYLSRRLLSNAAFKNDKQGATLALKRVLQTMIDRDYIREIGRAELMNKFGTTQKAYIVSNVNILG